MLYMNVALCRNGDIVAEDIRDMNGRVLVVRDTVLNDYILRRLESRGIDRVSIYSAGDLNDDLAFDKFREEYRGAVINIRTMLQGLSGGQRLDYDRLYETANMIHKGIGKNIQVIKYLDQIKTCDEYTYTHCVNTAFYAMLIGKWLGLASTRLEDLILSGILHDIGKVKIPHSVLNKQGCLSDAEYDLIKSHTVLGYELLLKDKKLELEVLKGVLQHHERYDGSGYPYRADRENISLYGRIIAIADVFDAMTSDRVYKTRVTPFEVFEMLKTLGVGLFDSRIVNVFTHNIVAHYTGARVLLTNGVEGEIVHIPPHDITSPIIKASSLYYDLSMDTSLKVRSFL